MVCGYTSMFSIFAKGSHFCNILFSFRRGEGGGVTNKEKDFEQILSFSIWPTHFEIEKWGKNEKGKISSPELLLCSHCPSDVPPPPPPPPPPPLSFSIWPTHTEIEKWGKNEKGKISSPELLLCSHSPSDFSPGKVSIAMVRAPCVRPSSSPESNLLIFYIGVKVH